MRDMVADAVLDHERAVHDSKQKKDALRIALAKTFGLSGWPQLVPGPRGLARVTQGEAFPPGPAFSGLAESYVAFTGDSEFQRITQAGTSDFPNALADILSALIIKNSTVNYRYQELVGQFTSVDNFKPQKRSRIRSIGDLPDLGDDATYDELSNAGDEAYSLTINQKGGTITVTRRMIMNDAGGLVQQLTEQAAEAAMRTLAKRAWNLVINNGTYGADGLALFHATHGNLGSAALSVTTLNAAREAIFAQTIPGSTDRLGLSGPFFLVVPIALEATALPINTCEYIPGSGTFEGNPWKGRFGANNERIFTNPLLTDTNDFYLFDLSGNAGVLEIAFLQGKQAPQIIASRPDTDSGLTQDRIVLKVRHEYECAIRDYRGAYKAVVA